MNLDLNTLLEGWPHEPGQIRVRKIRGNDGKEKIQLRIDLGLIQMETVGRPDGLRPRGSQSLLDWHRQRALEAEAVGDSFTLSSEDCGELHQEAIQYYHRYIALLELGDFVGVISDTQRNLDLFTFVSKYAEREEIAWSLEQFRGYVLMMNTRAKASLHLEREDIPAAIRQVEEGRDIILDLQKDRSQSGESSSEVKFLNEWLEELRSKCPPSKLEIMQRELDHAIASEAYERAAQLRDAIRAFRESGAQ